MTLELTRRGFLQGLLATAVIVSLPKTPSGIPLHDPFNPWAIKAPDGITYQWVRTALCGDPDPENVQLRLDNGWTFVKPATHPGAPVSSLGHAVETGGLVLMEQPTHLVEERMARERAPMMDRDHRVAGILREAMQEVAAVAAPKLKHISYTDADVSLWCLRKLGVSRDDGSGNGSTG